MRGRVLRISGQQCLVEIDGKQYQCRLRGRLKAGARMSNSPVITGDWVEIGDLEEGMIESVLPRRSNFTRAASGSRPYEQIVAVNIDQLVIVTSARQPNLRLGFIDRAIITALRGDINPIVVVNKIDLDHHGEIRPSVAQYTQLSYPVFFTSASTGAGMAEFVVQLKDKVTAFVGQSGVGKSSLLNWVEPGLGLKTREIMKRHDRGRHTTAAVQLYPLSQGGYVADTPGIKELHLCGVSPLNLVEYFAEMAPLVGDCYFRDCAHLSEPDCAVRAALAQGDISPYRYQSYVRIMEGLARE